MNRLRKILLGVVLQLSICVCLSLTAEAYDGDEHVTTPLSQLNFEEKSGTWVNPMCEDFGIEAEENQNEIATYSNDAEKAVSYNASDYMSFDEALEYFKDGIKNRSENIAPFKFYVEDSLVSDGNFYQLLHDKVKEHTGISTEGDTLIWEPKAASYKYQFAYDGTYFWVNFDFYQPEYLSTLQQEQETIRAIQEEMKKLNLDGMSDFDKIYTIYDYICSHVKYDSYTLTWLTEEVVSEDQIPESEEEIVMPETETEESMIEPEIEEIEMDSETNVETEIDMEVEETESVEE